jgi:2'-hydroxyisoflavone reductase
MRMLFLGGTRFVGRHIAEAAIAAGHDVVFAHRGRTNPALFPQHRHVAFDRYGDAGALAGIDAEIVIDASGYTPDSVRNSALAVADAVRTYVFISSIDAYEPGTPHMSETAPTRRLEAGANTSEPDPELYGAHKARCEELLIELLGETRVLNVRAGLMVGPYDHTDRFTYWPVRVARGGEILVPVGREFPVQFIDVRDVAAWVAGALPSGLHGTFNVCGTPGALTFGDVLDACARAAKTEPAYTWVSEPFLEKHAVAAWTELPLWLPDDPTLTGFRTARNDRAWKTGLRCRPLDETVRDVLDEYGRRPPEAKLQAGLTPEREAELLAAWRDERT